MDYSVLQFRPVLTESMPVLLKGALVTLQITILGVAAGIPLATVSALCRLSTNKGLRLISTIYVEVIRNTPFLVQLFIIYFCLPVVGISLDPYPAGLLALVISVGAYSTEEIRAGIESIHRGQVESALAIGMNKPQTLWYIVFPLAFRAVYPPLTNRVILVMLSSSMLAAISVEELTYQAMIEGARLFRVFETYVVVGVLYLLLANGLTWVLQQGKKWM